MVGWDMDVLPASRRRIRDRIPPGTRVPRGGTPSRPRRGDGSGVDAYRDGVHSWTRPAEDGSSSRVDSLLLSIPREEKAAVLMAADATTGDLATPARFSPAWVSRDGAGPEPHPSGASDLLRLPDSIALRNALTNPVTLSSTVDRFTMAQPDSRRCVTQAATSNPSTPGDALTGLALHDDPAKPVDGRGQLVRSVAGCRPSARQRRPREPLAPRPPSCVPPGELAVWMREEPQAIRCATRGPNVGTVAASGHILEPEVRLAVARNRAAPPDVLEACARVR